MIPTASERLLSPEAVLAAIRIPRPARRYGRYLAGGALVVVASSGGWLWNGRATARDDLGATRSQLAQARAITASAQEQVARTQDRLLEAQTTNAAWDTRYRALDAAVASTAKRDKDRQAVCTATIGAVNEYWKTQVRLAAAGDYLSDPPPALMAAINNCVAPTPKA